MHNEKNIEQLKQQLKAIGFADGLEFDICSKVCFSPSQFDIRSRFTRNGDIINVVIHFEQDDGRRYACLYYDASLRKEIVIAGETIEGIDIAILESKMTAVDWGFSRSDNNDNPVEIANKIEEVIDTLALLSQKDEGKRMADLLKFKYWSDTAVEHLIPATGSFKNHYEISQRFFIFEGLGISTDEAYRFLCNKWMEKKLLAKKRQTEKADDNEANMPGDNTGTVSLVKKQGKQNRRKIK